MRRDPTHMESVERWANYVRTHKDWRKLHARFIDSQFENAYRVIGELLKQPDGKKVIKELYGIKNEKGYPSIFSK